MNGTPRAINRALLIVIGLIFTGAGLHLVLVETVSAYAAAAHRATGGIGASIQGLLDSTTLPGQKDSWLWIGATVLMIVLVLLMLWWISVQGKGKTGIFAREYQEEGMRGIVELTGAVPEQAIKSALASRTDIVGVSVSTWTARGDAGLRIKVMPRQGAAPLRIAEDLDLLAAELQQTLGRGGPVVIHLAGGARSRMSRSERAR